MNRTLDQSPLDIQKLMVNPVQRRPGMRAAISVSKTLTITPYHEARYPLIAKIERKSVGSRI